MTPSRVFLTLFFIIILMTFSCCKRTENGQLFVAKVNLGRNEGEVGFRVVSREFSVKLDNGEWVTATCSDEISDSLKNGQLVQIVYDEDIKTWHVTKIVGYKEWKPSDLTR